MHPVTLPRWTARKLNSGYYTIEYGGAGSLGFYVTGEPIQALVTDGDMAGQICDLLNSCAWEEGLDD